MKKICYSFLLTAVVALVGLQLAGWGGAAPLRQIEGEDLSTGQVKASADSIPLATTEAGARSVSYTHLTLPTKRIV